MSWLCCCACAACCCMNARNWPSTAPEEALVAGAAGACVLLRAPTLPGEESCVSHGALGLQCAEPGATHLRGMHWPETMGASR